MGVAYNQFKAIYNTFDSSFTSIQNTARGSKKSTRRTKKGTARTIKTSRVEPATQDIPGFKLFGEIKLDILKSSKIIRKMSAGDRKEISWKITELEVDVNTERKLSSNLRSGGHHTNIALREDDDEFLCYLAYQYSKGLILREKRFHSYDDPEIYDALPKNCKKII